MNPSASSATAQPGAGISAVREAVDRAAARRAGSFRERLDRSRGVHD